MGGCDALKLLTFGKKEKKPIEETVSRDEITGMIDPTPLESIYPFVFKENKDCVESGGNFIRVIAFAAYPDEQRGNWLSDLKRLKGNITITQYVEPADSRYMIELYNNAIKNKAAELEKTNDPKQRFLIKKEMESAEFQLNQALDNKSTFVYICTYILIIEESLAKLKSLEENVQRILMKLKIKGLIPYYKMNDAYWSTLPIVNNRLRDYTYQMSNTTAASSFFPFDDSEICDLSPGAKIEGLNKTTGSLIAVNYNHKKTLNRNKFVIGTSGVGKTTYLKKGILQSIAFGKSRVYIIDPENEYSQLVEYFGGTVIHLSSSSKSIINPLEIFSTEIIAEGDQGERKSDVYIENLIRQKAQRLKGFFKTIKRDLNQVESSIIDTLVMSLYGRFRKVKSLEKMKHEDFPTLEDLYNAIDDLKKTNPEKYKRIEDFYYILETYVHGATTLFNGHTNIDLDKNLISFDLKPLQNEKDVQSACYLNTFSYLWDSITNDKENMDELIADEIHFLLNNEDSADFFFQAYKRFRKYNAAATVGTQQIQDLLRAPNDIGSAIVGNSYTKVFFGLENIGVDDVINKLKIKFSNPEISLLRSRRKGEALFINGTKRAFMDVFLTEEEMRLLNPEMYREKYNKDPNEQPDYESRIYLSPYEIEELDLDLDSSRGV